MCKNSLHHHIFNRLAQRSMVGADGWMDRNLCLGLEIRILIYDYPLR